jgi:hypothetical protein
MAVRIQLRRDTTANWETHNPTLAQGEMALELDNDTLEPFALKVGNAVDEWADLPYFYKQGDGSRQIIDFDAEIKLDDLYASFVSISGAIAFTLESDPAPVIAKNIIIYMEANGVNKPTFSSDFVVMWDNWDNADGEWNRVYIEYTQSGKAIVDLRHI